jgi:NADPH-dependent 2,4-dienoyl-CoA reductase/sulfur reductase-like enzyme
MRLLVIGGSDAGIRAALRMRELDGSAEASVLLADDYPNWSGCGLPYFLSGEMPDGRPGAPDGVRRYQDQSAPRCQLDCRRGDAFCSAEPEHRHVRLRRHGMAVERDDPEHVCPGSAKLRISPALALST